MDFFRRVQSLLPLPKQKYPKICRDHYRTPDKYCYQVGLGKREAQPHLVQENKGTPTRIDDNAYLEELSVQIQRDLDETAAWIQCDLNQTAAWIQCDLNQTAAWIQLDLEKMESHIQHDLTVPVDKVQRDLEQISTQIQKDLHELVAQMVIKLEENEQPTLEEKDEQIQPMLEEKAEQIQSDPEVKPATPHHDLKECPLVFSLENFLLHKVLGQGSFGKVMLAELKESGEYFAIKSLSKSSVLANGYTHYAMIEKRVMKLAVENPFIAHLHSTFQTKDNLFFVMEYIKGGNLFSHIEEKGRFDLATTRFYAAELTCGLQFLHRNGVIYRDLKLDNVMLDQDGHIKIVDFGQCRDNMFGCQRANSFCGSEHYIAPEIYQKREYTFPVDWWSLGVLLFEMLTGEAPFYGADHDELYRSVCWDSPSYPSWINTKSKDLLIKLLNRDARCRLGASGNIRAHPFFESIDWPALERREVEPPFKPKMDGDNDCCFVSKEFLNEAPKLSQGDSSSTGPMDQSAFADFAFVNSKWCSAQ